jgi:hypothetical protein
MSHRLVSGNSGKLTLKGELGGKLVCATPEWSLRNHKIIDLFLYDVWIILYGERFANHAIKIESSPH